MMSSISKRKREGPRTKIKSMGDHKEFLKRITKTLYYGELPKLPCLSLPVTEICCEVWSEAQRGRSLRRLHGDEAAEIARAACVSPCALLLAILYLERLNSCNPHYLANAAPAELFLVSLMVGSKFLQDDGEDDEVLCSEWAASGGLDLKQLNKIEMEFLSAIDWNIYVNESSFEKKLMWLERQVALRQARLRGFFTYADLAAACGGVGGALRGAALLSASVALAYLAAIIPLLASITLVSNTWLSASHSHETRVPPLIPLESNIITHDPHSLEADHHLNDSALNLITLDTGYGSDAHFTEYNRKCCTDWLNYREAEIKKHWFDGIIVQDWKSLEPWWSRTSVLNWLYQSSLIDPMQKWLERVNEYVDMYRRVMLNMETSAHVEQCHDDVTDGEQRCIRQWLNLSKLNALVVSMSDR